jgi:dTDP-4-amino-4,6-dideoxygalactose transaminase
MKNNKHKYRIFLSPPYQSGNELQSLSEVLDSNWLAPGGVHVERFEQRLTKITNRKYCVALNSGTAAIHLALKALYIEQGDYVICQSFSFVATANPISYLGAKPVFIDSEVDTLNINPELLEEAIVDLAEKGVKPKAIIYVHIYGNPAKVLELQRISDQYEIPLIEDAAEALGSQFQSKPVGQFGKISILSFNGNKVITTAGGGALITDDQEIEKRVKSLASQSRDKHVAFLHPEVGYNYQMSSLNAALGLAQLDQLQYCITRKREIFKTYLARIKSPGIKYIDEKENVLNRWLSVFILNTKAERDRVQILFHKRGIESRKPWKPLHTLNIYGEQMSYVNGVSNDIFERGICLPSGVGLNRDELEEILSLINVKE